MATVLHVIEASGFGTGRHLADLVRHIPDFEHIIALPRVRRADWDAPVGPLEQAAAADGARLHWVPMERFPLHPNNARSLRTLRRLIATVQPDVVHGHSSVGGALARLGAKHRTPVIYTPNGLFPGRAAIAIERALRSRTTAVVAVSASEAEELVARNIVEESMVRVIPNGIDPTLRVGDHGLRQLAGIGEGIFVVAFVGRFSRQKDPMTFLRALAILSDRGRFDDARAVVVASGPLAGAFRTELAQLQLGDRVELLGPVPDVATRLGDVDALVSTSRWEGGPYVPLEAMRAGVPVVLSNCVGNRDLLDVGQAGLLFDVGDAVGLAAQLDHLQDRPSLRRKLGAEGRRLVAERYAVADQAAATQALYAEVIKAAGR